MKFSASIYVDNQQEIQFPVSWIVSHFPRSVEKVYIFASDDSNLSAALAGVDDPRVISEPIGIHIRSPGDTATAQNECVRRVDRTEYDAHLVVQADIWPLPIMYERLAKLPYQADSAPHTVTVEHLRLHAQTHRTHFGVTVIYPKTSQEKLTFHSSAYPYSYHVLGSSAEPSAMALDIGWHSAAMIARHFRAHARTWSSPEQGELAKLYDKDRRAFMQAFLERTLRNMGPRLDPMPLDGPYGEIVAATELQEEYDEACELIRLLPKTKPRQPIPSPSPSPSPSPAQTQTQTPHIPRPVPQTRKPGAARLKRIKKNRG